MRHKKPYEAIRNILNRDRNSPPQFSAWLYAVRFLLIFSASCAIGILIVSNTDYAPTYGDEIESFFMGFAPSDTASWLYHAVRASLFEVSLLTLSLLSALTYFCPAIIHTVNLLGGIVSGICIEAVAGNGMIPQKMILVYVLTASGFAILLAFWSAELLKLNRQCATGPKKKPSHSIVYVSPVIGRLLKSSLTTFLIFGVFRLLASLMMTVTAILSHYQ